MAKWLTTALVLLLLCGSLGAQDYNVAHRPRAAFPNILTNATTDCGSAAACAVTLPSGAASGDLILIFIDSRGTTAATWTQTSGTTGWTELVDDRSSAIYYKVIGASEATPSFDCTETAEIAALAHRITGFDSGESPEASATANGSSANPDSASLSPSWGSAKASWFSVFSLNGARTISSLPSGYSNQVYQAAGAGGGATAIGSSNIDSAASSEDPGSYTVSGTAAWNAWTIGVKGS